MILKLNTFLTIIVTFYVAVATRASEPEDLFKKAAAFYSRSYGGRPWPANEKSGLELLTASAEANYPPALYNMFLGYKLGYLGKADEGKAKAYRIRWLLAEDSPKSYLELARGSLGLWSQVPDPARRQELPKGCIFTGEIVSNERQPAEDFGFYGTPRNEEPRDDERAVLLLLTSVELALSRDTTGVDREAAENATELLIGAVVGTPIPVNADRTLIIARGYALKGRVFRTILRATSAKLVSPERAMTGSLRLFDDMPDDELLKSFSE